MVREQGKEVGNETHKKRGSMAPHDCGDDGRCSAVGWTTIMVLVATSSLIRSTCPVDALRSDLTKRNRRGNKYLIQTTVRGVLCGWLYLRVGGSHSEA